MWNYAKKQANVLIRGKSGMSSLEMVIAILIFVVLFAAFVDLAIIGVKFNTTTQAVQYVTRVAAVQGGIMDRAPIGYPGGDEAYMTRSEILSRLEDNMGASGFKKEDWTLTVNGASVRSSQVRSDYQDVIEVQLTAKQRWTMLSNMMPGNLDFDMKNKRSTVSEFRYDASSW